MTVIAVVSGQLAAAPESRTSKAGNSFGCCRTKVPIGESFQFWSCMAFDDDAKRDLMGLRQGDAVAVTGPISASTYQSKSDETRIDLKVIANRVLVLRAEPQRRRWQSHGEDF